MKIYLVRHGQTDFNLKNLLQGSTDNPLNETGRQQAGQLAQMLKDVPFDVIYSSPLKRALETAQIIRESNVNRPPIILDDRLKEIDMGEWEGKYYPAIMEEYREMFERVKEDPFLYSPPGGEPFPAFVERIRSFLDDLRERDHNITLIVAHQMVNSVIRILLEGADWREFWTRRQKNGEVWILDLENKEVEAC